MAAKNIPHKTKEKYPNFLDRPLSCYAAFKYNLFVESFPEAIGGKSRSKYMYLEQFMQSHNYSLDS